MKAYQLVRTVINKEVVPEQEGRGRTGYGNLGRVRVLVYSVLKGIHNDSELERHLEKRPDARRGLRLPSVPDRTSISKWRRKYAELVREVFEEVSDLARELTGSELLVVDSTPLVDYRDDDARVGYYSEGPFKGFKAHISVNQLGLPMRSRVSRGNRHDTNLLRASIGRDLQSPGRCRLRLQRKQATS